jgi:hypothetical protein
MEDYTASSSIISNDGTNKRKKRRQKAVDDPLSVQHQSTTKKKPPVKRSKQERMNYCKLLKDRGFTLCDKLASWHSKTGHDFLLVMRSRPIPTATNTTKRNQQQQQQQQELTGSTLVANDQQQQQQQVVSSNIAIKSDTPEVRAGVIQLPNTAEWVVMSSVESPTSEAFTKFYTQLIMPAMTQVFKTVTPHSQVMAHIEEVAASRLRQERLIAENHPDALNDPQRLQDLKKEMRSELVLPQVANFIYPDLFPHLFPPEGIEPNILFPFSRGVANKSLDPDEISEMNGGNGGGSSNGDNSSYYSSQSSDDESYTGHHYQQQHQQQHLHNSSNSISTVPTSTTHHVNLPYPTPEELMIIMQQYNNEIKV